MATLRKALDQVPDPRSRFGRRHSLGAILVLAVCAMPCGAKSLYAISQWDREQGTPVAQALSFTRHQTPSLATLHRVFRVLNRAAFERELVQWLQDQGLITGEALAIDGKRLRGIHGEEVPGRTSGSRLHPAERPGSWPASGALLGADADGLGKNIQTSFN